MKPDTKTLGFIGSSNGHERQRGNREVAQHPPSHSNSPRLPDDLKQQADARSSVPGHASLVPLHGRLGVMVAGLSRHKDRTQGSDPDSVSNTSWVGSQSLLTSYSVSNLSSTIAEASRPPGQGIPTRDTHARSIRVSKLPKGVRTNQGWTE